MSSFAIVRFVASNEVEVVPIRWIKGENCLWPPENTRNVVKIVRKMSRPQETWTSHPIKILGSYATCDDARKRLKKAEDTSDLTSDPDGYGRGKRKRLSSASSTTSELTFESSTGLCLPAQPVFGPTAIEIEQDDAVENETDGLLHKTFKKTVLKELMILKTSLQQMKQNQQEIMNVLCSSVSRNPHHHGEDEPLPFSFPVKNQEEVDVVEDNLQKNPGIKERVVNQIAQIGGVSLEMNVPRVLRKMFTDEVAQEYSWLGAKGKKALSTLSLSGVVFAAVRRSYPNAMDSTIEIAVKNWLRHAKARAKPKDIDV